MKKNIFIGILLFLISPLSQACTSFGAITSSGTILGKNRDYFYSAQTVGLLKPRSSLLNWYNNDYHHANVFYALESNDGISMGVNNHGVAAIEEDALMPKLMSDNFKNHQKLTSKLKTGTPDGIVLYGILQNFDSIHEIKSYLSPIFSHAQPDFYQISDNKEILTVEVSLQKNKQGAHPYTYVIYSKKGNYFTHTNIYLSPQFTALNHLPLNPNALASTTNRLKTISHFMSDTKERTIDTASQWFMNTYSTISSPQNQCLNTSIFRSDLQGLQTVILNRSYDKVFGTTASMIFSNHGNLNNSHIYVKVIDSITVEKNNQQLIRYRDLKTTYANLFNGSRLHFIKHTMLRNLPVNGVCR